MATRLRLRAGPELDAELEYVRRQQAEAPPANDNAARWRRGDLRHKHQAHMLPFVDAFDEWDVRRRTEAYRQLCEQLEDAGEHPIDDVWMDYFSRRVGKTGRWIVGLTALAIVRPGSSFTYFTAKYADIGEIIVPLARMIVMADDCPKECRPEFQKSRGEHRMGLYFPNGSHIKLVGVDNDPDSLRGRFSDGMVGSEVSFIRAIDGMGLEDTIRSVLMPQFQGRPHAFLALETSAPRDPDHPVLQLFKPDCERRGAVCEGTIDCNTTLSERDKRKYLREAGGRGHPTCEREYFNVVSRDASQYVIPEFNEQVHVREVERPDYALGYVASDPGDSDLFGLVFGYWHFTMAKLVIEASWAMRNAPDRQVAAVTSYFEWKLWGRPPSTSLGDIPVREHAGRAGWVELLTGTAATLEDCSELRELARREDEGLERWRPKQDPAGRFTYWDGAAIQQNPHMRVSDVDKRMIRNMSTEYGLAFAPTRKDEAEAQKNLLRDAIGAGSVLFLPTAGPVIKHVQNAIWNDRRTDWQRHPIHGHYDCLASLIYLHRNVSKDRNPAVPGIHLLERDTQAIAPHIQAQQEREARLLEEGFWGNAGDDRVSRVTGGPRRVTRR
jgi:hypothetical protein